MSWTSPNSDHKLSLLVQKFFINFLTLSIFIVLSLLVQMHTPTYGHALTERDILGRQRGSFHLGVDLPQSLWAPYAQVLASQGGSPHRQYSRTVLAEQLRVGGGAAGHVCSHQMQGGRNGQTDLETLVICSHEFFYLRGWYGLQQNIASVRSCSLRVRGWSGEY